MCSENLWEAEFIGYRLDKMANSVSFQVVIKCPDISDLRKCYLGLWVLETQSIIAGESWREELGGSWSHDSPHMEMSARAQVSLFYSCGTPAHKRCSPQLRCVFPLQSP